MMKKGGASALLQKVNYQLKGERPVKTPEELEEENLDAYFSSLTKKSKKTEIDWSKFGEGSDLDISEKAEVKPKGGASKFLKKKSAPAEADDTKFTKKKTSKPASTAGAQSLDNTGKSSALNKAAAYTSKYGTPKAAPYRKEMVLLSDSDMDLSLSMDEEVLADVQKLKASNSNKPKQNTSKTATPGGKHTSSPSKPAGYYAQQAAKLRLSSPGPYQSALLAETDDDSSSMQIGKSGNKFMKKKPTSAPEPQPEIPKEKFTKSDHEEKTPRPSMFQLKSSQKYSTQVRLDTDEESMADFIGGLSNSSGGVTPRVAGKKGGHTKSSKLNTMQGSSPKVTPRGILRTPRSTQSPSTMELISEEESDKSYQMEEEDNSSVSSAASFKLNVLDVDALDLDPIVKSMPAKQDSRKKKMKEVKLDITPRYSDDEKHAKFKKKKEKKENDMFSNMGLHTVDELFGGHSDKSEDESEASEIQTGGATSEIQTIADDSGRQTPLRSILSPTPRTPRSSRSRVKLSLNKVTEMRSRSPSPEIISTARATRTSIDYDEDFEESITTEQPSSVKTIQTDSETETDNDAYTSQSRSRRYSNSRRKSEDYYSDDFTSATETSRRVRSASRGSSGGSYSEDFTDFTDTSDRSRSPSPQPRRSVKTRSCEVQTGPDVGLVYHWNVQRGDVASLGLAYGLGAVDPTPIASHVVSPDAIEAMTAYSPSVLALNDMLRQQIQMTSTFVESQKRLHRSLLSTAILPDFEYTTLDDTKQYIKRHRKKTLTFDEALAQVKCDMGME